MMWRPEWGPQRFLVGILPQYEAGGGHFVCVWFHNSKWNSCFLRRSYFAGSKRWNWAGRPGPEVFDFRGTRRSSSGTRLRKFRLSSWVPRTASQRCWTWLRVTFSAVVQNRRAASGVCRGVGRGRRRKWCCGPKASGGGAETGNHWASAASVAARVCMSVSFTSA